MPTFIKSILTLFLYLGCQLGIQAATVLWDDDFEGAAKTAVNGSNIIMTVADSPTGVGMAMSFEDKTATGTWGSEISPLPTRTFKLADYGAVAGVDKMILNFDVFIPSATKAVGDNIYFFVRLLVEDGSDNGSSSSNSVIFATNNLQRDVWQTVTGTITIGATAKNLTTNDMEPTAKVASFIAWNDAGVVNEAGILGYIDNVQLVITPEPSSSLLCLVGMMSLVVRRKKSS